MVDFEIPSDLLYTEEHEWLRVDGDQGRTGVTDYAQHELTDVVYVVLPDEGDAFDRGDVYAEAESTKVAAEVYAPVSGTVVDVNEALLDRPELVNEDPYGDGWFAAFELDDPDEPADLLGPDQYEALLEGEA